MSVANVRGDEPPDTATVQLRFDCLRETKRDDISLVMDPTGGLRDSLGHEVRDFAGIVALRPKQTPLRIVVGIEDQEETPIRRLVEIRKKLAASAKGRRIDLIIVAD
jgi:hypothetical protein